MSAAAPITPGRWRLPTIGLLGGLLLASASCTGYNAANPPGTEVTLLYIAPVQNDAFVSEFAALFETQLRQAFLETAAVRLVDLEDEAEEVLRVRLEGYEEENTAYASADTGRPIAATARIRAHYTLGTPEEADAFIADARQEVRIPIYAASGDSFHRPRYQSEPALARSLAQSLRDDILNPWLRR